MATGRLTALSLADELGIPLVVCRDAPAGGRPPGGGGGLIETLREQDRRMVVGVGRTSVVSWLVEGDRQILGPGGKTMTVRSTRGPM